MRLRGVLPKAYQGGNQPYEEDIPGEARVLTLVETETIGNGLVATHGHTLDVLVLYLGTEDEMTCVVSTYGTPIDFSRGSDPVSISDNPADLLPFGIPDGGGWGGFFRAYPSGADAVSNWKRFLWSERTPGSLPRTGK